VAHALTFGWFGGAYLSTSVQKVAILVNPILTFYNVGIVCLATKLQSQHTKHNTKHTTTNMSHHRPTLGGFALYCHGNITMAPTPLQRVSPQVHAKFMPAGLAAPCWVFRLGR
jgi:hypothetical protein